MKSFYKAGTNKKKSTKLNMTKSVFPISVKFLINKEVCFLLICTVRSYMEATT